MDVALFFKRPWLTGIGCGALIAFAAYLPSVLWTPLPWYRIAAVFAIGWLMFWFVTAAVKRSSEMGYPVCGACAAERGIENLPDGPCPHETLLRMAEALAVKSEGRRLLQGVVQSLTPDEAREVALGTAQAFIDRLGVTTDDLRAATRSWDGGRKRT